MFINSCHQQNKRQTLWHGSVVIVFFSRFRQDNRTARFAVSLRGSEGALLFEKEASLGRVHGLERSRSRLRNDTKQEGCGFNFDERPQDPLPYQRECVWWPWSRCAASKPDSNPCKLARRRRESCNRSLLTTPLSIRKHETDPSELRTNPSSSSPDRYSGARIVIRGPSLSARTTHTLIPTPLKTNCDE